MSLTDRTADYAKEIVDKLNRSGLRAEVDVRNEKIGYKIREAQLEKIPYMFIVGDKEKEEGVISVRSRKDGDLGVKTFDDILASLKEENDSKRV
jgi:threonyl-tRNA synthetase